MKENASERVLLTSMFDGVVACVWLTRFTDDPSASISETGFRGSLFFRGKMYDNVFTRRRGVTSLSWPKPKIKFDFKGRVFKYAKGKSVEEFNLQSFWDEPGEDSYLREPAAFQIMQEAGVPASDTFYVRIRQNGAFFGLFAFIEQVEDGFLEVWHFKLFIDSHLPSTILHCGISKQYLFCKSKELIHSPWVNNRSSRGLGGEMVID